MIFLIIIAPTAFLLRILDCYCTQLLFFFDLLMFDCIVAVISKQQQQKNKQKNPQKTKKKNNNNRTTHSLLRTSFFVAHLFFSSSCKLQSHQNFQLSVALLCLPVVLTIFGSAAVWYRHTEWQIYYAPVYLTNLDDTCTMVAVLLLLLAASRCVPKRAAAAIS